MNTTQLQCFLEVANQLSYAGAAKTLHLSQPAVTKKIKSLEDELQVKLFDRDTRHVQLTDEGKLFFPNALSLYSQEMSIRTTLLHSQQQKKYHLYIGIFGLEAHLFLAEILARVHQQLPNLRVDIVGADFEPLRNGLATHSLDILIGAKELFEAKQNVADYYENLSDMTLKVALPDWLDIDLPTSLSLQELTPERMAEYLPDADRLTCLDFDKMLPNISDVNEMLHRFFDHTITCDNIEAALTLVRAGFGYMIMPESNFLQRRKLQYLTVTDAPLFHYGCFYDKENHNPALKILLAELHRYFAS